MTNSTAAPSMRVRIAFTAVVTLALASLVIAILFPALGRARRNSMSYPGESAARQVAFEDANYASITPAVTLFAPATDKAVADSRAIARQASVGLKVASIADAYAQVTHVARPALGEFVQSSGYQSHDRSNNAQVTLRIATDRLDAALAELRAIGDVTHESSSADDVTDRLIDLDAHIRNEQRVEREMLELLDARSGDPLKDLLSLRESLADVRLQIERLLAQQSALKRRVAFATVQVTLHTEATSEAGVFARAWSDGVHGLTRSIAWLVQVVVGGAIAWIILAAIGLLAWRVHKSDAQKTTSSTSGA